MTNIQTHKVNAPSREQRYTVTPNPASADADDDFGFNETSSSFKTLTQREWRIIMPFSKEMILGASGNQGSAGFYTHQIEQSCRFDYVDNSHFDKNYGDGTEGLTQILL